MKVSGKGKKYLSGLEKDIKRDGLKQPLILAVSKISERAYLYEGNHRMVVLKKCNVEWVPLKVNYLFMNDDYDRRFPFILTLMHGTWPDHPIHEQLGFITNELPTLSRDYDS